ncbi:hypothetical protein J1N35_043860, partial [Gossypium stocksii]
IDWGKFKKEWKESNRVFFLENPREAMVLPEKSRAKRNESLKRHLFNPLETKFRFLL